MTKELTKYLDSWGDASTVLNNSLNARVSESRKRLEETKAASAYALSIRKASEGAWVQDTDSLAGKLGNLAASTASTITRMVGDVGALPYSLDAAQNQGMTDEEDKAAFSRFKQGAATERDMLRLNRRISNVADVEAPVDPMEQLAGGASNNTGQRTVLEALEKTEVRRNEANDIRKIFDTSSIVNKTDSFRMAEQASRLAQQDDGITADAWNKLTGGNRTGVERLEAAATLASKAPGWFADRLKLAADNPWAVANAAPDAAASVALNLTPVGRALNVLQTSGMGASAYDRGIENFRKDGVNNPDGDLYADQKTLDRMKLGAFGVVGAELIGDELMSSAVKAFSKGTSATGKALGVNAKAAEEAAEEITKSGFKASLLQTGKSIGTVAGKLGGAAESEAITETVSTIFEGMAQNKDATAEDLIIANTVGWALGGGMPVAAAGGAVAKAAVQAGAAAATSAADTYKEAKANVAAEQAKAEAETQLFNDAVAQGNPDLFLDPENKETYNPVKAVEVLSFLAQAEGVTEEQKTSYQAKAEEILVGIQTEVDNAKLNAETTPESLQAQIDEVKGRIASLDAGTPSETTEVAKAQLQQGVEILQTQLDKFDPNSIQTAKDKYESLLKLQENTVEAVSRFANTQTDASVASTASTPEEYNALLNTAATAPQGSPEGADAVQKLKIRSMASPGAVSVKDVDNLLNAQKSSLSQEDRTYFSLYRNMVQAFEDAVNTTSGFKSTGQVQSEVLYGDPSQDQKGLVQYQERFNRFVMNGVFSAASQEVAQLTKFATQHATKLAAVQSAFEIAQRTKGTYRVYQDPESGNEWKAQRVPDGGINNRQKGEYFISKSSGKLVENIGSEQVAMKDTLMFMANIKDSKGVAMADANAVSSITNRAYESLQANWRANGVIKSGGQPNGTAGNGQQGTGTGEPASLPSTATSTSTASVSDQSVPASAEPSPVAQTSGLEQPAAGSPDASGGTEVATAVGGTESNISNISNNNNNLISQAPVDDIVEAPAGKLGAFTSELPAQEPVGEDGKPTKKSLLREAYTKFRSQITQKNSSPLAKTKDIFSKITTGEVKIEGDPELVRKTLNFIKDSNETIAQFAEIDNPQANFYSKTPIDFLLSQGNLTKEEFVAARKLFQDSGSKNPESVMEENLLTAISLGALEAFNGLTASLVNDNETINKMLGRSKNAEVDSDTREKFSFIGTRNYLVYASAGQAITEALGLKETSEATAELMEKLQQNLGVYAVEVLMKAGLAEAQSISNQEMSRFMGQEVDTKSEATSTFIRATRQARPKDWKGKGNWYQSKLSSAADSFKDSMKGSTRVLNDVFGMPSQEVRPTFKPVEFSQTLVRKGVALVPVMLQKILTKKNAEEHFLNKGGSNMVFAMYNSEGGRESLLKMMGWKDPALAQASDRNSVIAKNDSLENDLDKSIEFMQEVADREAANDKKPVAFFYQQSVWKNQRAGLEQNVFNPQTIKLARHLIHKKSWLTEIDPKASTPEAQEMLERFKLRVLEGFGVKTDRLTNATTLPQFETLLERDYIQAALPALAKVQANPDEAELSAAENAAIAIAVSKMGEGMKSFHALQALAQYDQASKANGGKGEVFTSDLTGEVDGVNNGPMLSRLLLGGAYSAAKLYETITKGGFFGPDSKFTAYNQYREQTGELDFYQDVMKSLGESLAKKYKGNYLDPIWILAGKYIKDGEVTSDGRNAVKPSINGLNFGSSVEKAARMMGEDFLSNIYKNIGKEYEKAQDPAQAKDAYDKGRQFIQAINALLEDRADLLPEDYDLADLHSHWFTPKQEAAIKESFYQTVGVEMENTLTEKFGDMLLVRDQMVKTSNTMFSVYGAAYQALRAEMLSKARAEKRLKPTEDLTKQDLIELDRALADIAPFIDTAFSRMGRGTDKYSKFAGALIAKFAKTVSSLEDKTYDTAVKLDPQFSVDNQKQRQGRGKQKAPTSPGVLIGSALTHSFDSYISHMAAMSTEALNIHDAHVTGLRDYNQVAQNLNAATWKGLLTYSPAKATYYAAVNQIKGLNDLMGNPAISKSVKQAVINSLEAGMAKDWKWKKENPSATWADYLANTLKEAREQAYFSDKVRLEALSQMQVIDQYALEGGAYVVKPEDRQAALDALAKLEEFRKQAPEGQLKMLQDVARNFGKGTASAQQPQNQAAEKVKDFFTTNLAFALKAMEVAMQSPTTEPEIKELIEAYRNRKNDGASFSFAQAARLQSYLESIKAQGEKAQAPGARNTPLGLTRPGKNKMVLLPENSKGKAFTKLLLRSFSTSTQSGLETLTAIAKRVSSAITDDVSVVMLSSDMTEEEMNKIPKPETAATDVAWTVRGTDGKITVYLKDATFKHSYSPEAMVHELVHAATMEIVDNPKTPNQNKAVAQLNNILGLAQTYIANNGLSDKFAVMVQDIDELLAYGMTNKAFQMEVLAKIPMREDSRLGFSNALRQFVQSIVQMIMGDKAKDAEGTALGELLMAGTELIDQARKQNTAAIKKATEAVNGSGNGGTEAKIRSMAATNTAQDFTTEQVFEAMTPGSDAVFDNTLRQRLSELVYQLHGPYGAIKAQWDPVLGNNPLDAWANTLVQGNRPWQSSILSSGMRFSEREQFLAEQVEAVMTEILASRNTTSNGSVRQLERLFLQARKDLKGKINQGVYDFIFTVQSVNGQPSPHLARFAAAALANKDFNKALEIHTDHTSLAKSSLAGKSWVERLNSLWTRLLESITTLGSGLKLKNPVNQNIESLMHKLVQSEVRAKERLNGRRNILEQIGDRMAPVYEKTEDLLKAGGEKAVKAVGQAATSKFVTTNTFAAVRTVGAGLDLITNNRASAIANGLTMAYNKSKSGKHNQAMQLLNYVKGPGQWVVAMIREAKRIEGERKSIITGVSKAVLAGFDQGGANLTEDQKASISALLLRTGAHALIEGNAYTVQDIQKFYEDPKALQSAIQKEVAALGSPALLNFYVAQVKGLAAKSITGQTYLDNQLLNTYAIARAALRPEVVAETDAVQVQPVLNRLTALYAIEYSGNAPHPNSILSQASLRDDLLQVLRTENNRGNENGVLATLKTYAYLEKDARAKLFDGAEALMIHGFLPEIHNPRVDVHFVKENPNGTPSPEAQRLLDQGYERVGKAETDPHDTDQRPAAIYVARGAAMTRYQSGAFSMTGTASRGTERHNQYFSNYTREGVENQISMNKIDARAQRAAANQVNLSLGWKPDFTKFQTRLVPLINANGDLVDYRYMMNEASRNSLLERDNRFEHLMGVMAGTTYDKVAGQAQNKELVNAMRDIWRTEGKSNPEKFILVGSRSTDPELREIWDLLPSATQDTITRTWGSEGMMVPKEMVLPLFGNRKYSLGQMWDKTINPNTLRGKLEGAFKAIATKTFEVVAYRFMKDKNGNKFTKAQAKQYAKRTGKLISVGEEFALEVAREIKDTIVVKTISVMWNNFVSNFSLLLVHGVSINDAIALQKEAWLAVSDYQRDKDALDALLLQLNTGLGQLSRGELLSEIARLEDSINRNPAKELIDAGMLPTIVEDLDGEEDIYSFKSRLSDWAEDKTKGWPQGVINAGKFLYMTHDTALYKFLSKSTMYGDFMGRYALYKHLTEKIRNPVSKEDALFQASEAFVNYDIPMPKSLQYLDDLFILPFLKYTLSIQRVLFRLLKERPLAVLSSIGLSQFFDSVAMVTDSSLVMKAGNNPFALGPLGFATTLDDRATINALGSAIGLIK